MNDPTIPAVQSMIILAITMAFIGLLTGCASPPPSERDLWRIPQIQGEKS